MGWFIEMDRLTLSNEAPMTEKRFPYGQSEWHCGESERWNAVLERYGPENVRAILAGPYSAVGSRASIGVGTVIDIPKGFAQEWLAWHDRQRSQREAAFRTSQIYWTRWAAIAATVVAIAGVVGWIVTIWLSANK
jgi:hypothetical protein